jgi:hypothetical protein
MDFKEDPDYSAFKDDIRRMFDEYYANQIVEKLMNIETSEIFKQELKEARQSVALLIAERCVTKCLIQNEIIDREDKNYNKKVKTLNSFFLAASWSKILADSSLKTII